MFGGDASAAAIALPTKLVPAPRGVMESPASIPAQMTALASLAERGKATACGSI